jgi:hypothetical protein
MNSAGPRTRRPPIPQAVFPFVPFDLPAVLETVRRERVPQAPAGIPVAFYEQESLACIHFREGGATGIGLHAILNRAELPEMVLRFLFTHELLHTVIPSREIRGKLVAHPPEFFEAELRAVPVGEVADAWSWIWGNFFTHLKRQPRVQRIDVKRGWRDSFRDPLRSVEECRGLRGTTGNSAESGFSFPMDIETGEAFAIAA